MKKTILIPILVVGIIAIVAGTSVGLWYALTPTDDSELSVVSITSQPENDTVTVVLTCEEETSTGQNHNNRHQRKFAYMHQIQIKNASSGETLCQEQYQWRYRQRVQLGNTYSYQLHVEGLEQGQMLQLRIEYNNGKVLTHNFTVNN
ncbi:MAG: hypothetical protein EAX90_11905 [Candidatus Heimdallarchaeota archaeon]|nr:hypothetical protein [Candidatus Heimdallarchaeota archaeon]